jgi:hypothetical protein
MLKTTRSRNNPESAVPSTQSNKNQLLLTPEKRQWKEDTTSTAGKSRPSPNMFRMTESRSIQTASLKTVRSVPLLEYFPLECEFKYTGYPFFESRLALTAPEL